MGNLITIPQNSVKSVFLLTLHIFQRIVLKGSGVILIFSHDPFFRVFGYILNVIYIIFFVADHMVVKTALPDVLPDFFVAESF